MVPRARRQGEREVPRLRAGTRRAVRWWKAHHRPPIPSLHRKNQPVTKKRTKIVIKLPKKRMHYVLFAADSPFKGKKVESKKAFKRKPKHGHKD